MLGSAAFVAFWLLTPSRALAIAPALITAAVVYFFISFSAEKLKQHFGEIGELLYLSQWYLLKPCYRRDFLTILILGNHARTVKVGPFGFAGLERFTDAFFRVYQLCLIIKKVVNIQKYA